MNREIVEYEGILAEVVIGNAGGHFMLSMNVVRAKDICNVPYRQWDEIQDECVEAVTKTGNWIRIGQSADNSQNQAEVYYNGWLLTGELVSIERESEWFTKYHCRNALFPFTITIEVDHYPFDDLEIVPMSERDEEYERAFQEDQRERRYHSYLKYRGEEQKHKDAIDYQTYLSKHKPLIEIY